MTSQFFGTRFTPPDHQEEGGNRSRSIDRTAFPPNGYYASAGGGTVVYATGMSGLNGPIVLSVAEGTTSANLYQYGPSGVQVVSDKNLTDNSVIYGTIEYPWQRLVRVTQEDHRTLPCSKRA